MKEKKSMYMLSVLIVMFMIPGVIATVTLHNESIMRNYVGGSLIKGPITLSFTNEPADALVQSAVPGGKSFYEVLKSANLQSGVHYNCSVSSCLQTYQISGTPISSIAIDEGGEYHIGLLVEGKDVSIQNLDFLLASEVPASCSRQLEMRALDENTSMYNRNYLPDTSQCGGSTQGCFATNLAESDYKYVTLSTLNYCNNVTLEPAPAYAFSTSVRASGNTSAIILRLFNAEGDARGSCTAQVDGTGNRVAQCIINHTVTTSGSYFMCASAKENKNEYEIRFETKGDICGGAGVGKTNSGDYEIKATPLPYAPFTNVSISASFAGATGMRLSDEADRYVEHVYGRQCTNGCVIPISLKGISQTVRLQNATLVYSAEENRITERNIYSVNRSVPTLNSNKALSIDISNAGFTLPISARSGRFTFRIGQNSLLGNGIPLNITPGFSFEIVPRVVLPGVETTFSIISKENISESIWNFGDGTSITVIGVSAQHRYIQGNNYTISVTAKSRSGVNVTRSIEIILGEARESASQIINATSASLGNFTFSVSQLPTAVQPAINSRLNVSLLQTQVKAVQAAYAQASNESDYVSIVEQALRISIPKDIGISDSGTVPFFLGFDRVEPAFVQILSNASVPAEKREEMLDNLIDWNRKTYDANVAFSVISIADSQGSITPLISHFIVTQRALREAGGEVYFVIDRPREEIVFIGNPEIKTVQGEGVSGTAIRVTGSPIEFYVETEVEYGQLGAHFAPMLDVLGSYEVREPTPPREYPLQWVIIWISVIIVGTFIMYLILQQWYKRHYERYLFPNADDLYNILTFIHNSRSSGMLDEAIRKSLRGSGWSSEQLSYAFKKIDGKRTGMFEIPLFRGSEQRRVLEEIQKRQQGFGRDHKVY